MIAPKEKLNATKLLNLAPTLLGRLKRVAAMIGDTENEIIRRGLVVELDRIESQASVEQLRMAKLQQIAKARGVAVDAVIEEMLQSVTAPALPGMTELASATLPTGTEG